MKPAIAQSFQRLLAKHVIIAAVPQHHGPAAILPLRDDSFEGRVFDRVVLDLHRQMLLAFLPGKPLWHGPGFQHPFHFQAEVVVQSARVVFLNDETRGALDQLRERLAAFRLGRHPEIPLLLVFG